MNYRRCFFPLVAGFACNGLLYLLALLFIGLWKGVLGEQWAAICSSPADALGYMACLGALALLLSLVLAAALALLAKWVFSCPGYSFRAQAGIYVLALFPSFLLLPSLALVCFLPCLFLFVSLRRLPEKA